MKVFQLFFLLFIYNILYSQSKDILPNSSTRVGVSFLGNSLMHLSKELKINKSITISPKIGLGFQYKSGTNFLTMERFKELGVSPVFESDVRFYLTMNNSNRKGKINKLFSGTYVSANPLLTLRPFGSNYNFISTESIFAGFLSAGKQIDKNSGFFINYSVGYLLGYVMLTENKKNEIPPNYYLNFTLGFHF